MLYAICNQKLIKKHIFQFLQIVCFTYDLWWLIPWAINATLLGPRGCLGMVSVHLAFLNHSEFAMGSLFLAFFWIRYILSRIMYCICINSVLIFCHLILTILSIHTYFCLHKWTGCFSLHWGRKIGHSALAELPIYREYTHGRAVTRTRTDLLKQGKTYQMVEIPSYSYGCLIKNNRVGEGRFTPPPLLYNYLKLY